MKKISQLELIKIIATEDNPEEKLKELGITEDEFNSIILDDNDIYDDINYNRIFSNEEKDKIAPDILNYLLHLLKNRSVTPLQFEKIMNSILFLNSFTPKKINLRVVEHIIDKIVISEVISKNDDFTNFNGNEKLTPSKYIN